MPITLRTVNTGVSTRFCSFCPIPTVLVRNINFKALRAYDQNCPELSKLIKTSRNDQKQTLISAHLGHKSQVREAHRGQGPPF